jgi:hypothetical protein
MDLFPTKKTCLKYKVHGQNIPGETIVRAKNSITLASGAIMILSAAHGTLLIQTDTNGPSRDFQP